MAREDFVGEVIGLFEGAVGREPRVLGEFGDYADLDNEAVDHIVRSILASDSIVPAVVAPADERLWFGL